jgi:HAE1 family hydrophobic/amphiphilic exporter-1
MRCSQLLHVGQRRNVIERVVGYVFGMLAGAYGRLLGWILGWGPWRYAIVLVSLLIFAASLLLIRGIPREEVPAQDQGLFMVRLRGPVDWSISRTNEVVRQIEAIMNRRGELESCFANAGSHSGEANEGMFFINMKPRSERPLGPSGRPITQQESIVELRKELNVFPGVEVIVLDRSRMGLSGGGRGGGLPVSFSIRGPDWQQLGTLSAAFKDRMADSGTMVDVSSDYRVGMPEIQVLPNRQKTLAHDVDVRALGETVRALVGGYRIAKFTYQGRRYDVRVRLLRNERLRPEDIGLLYVRNRSGEAVRLSELVDIETRPSLQSIFRVNRLRAVTVSANPAPGVPQNEALDEVARISSEILPEGYELVLTGSSRSASESFGGLAFGFLAGLVVAYMVLASQFNSYLHPFTILLALPFSLTGALLGLYFFHQSLNVFSAIALILLAGIVKKNSILLVDFTNQLRKEGRGYNDALREACPIRLRPILMTSVATVAGAIPAALAMGPGGELRIPMAIAVIGGVIVSTLLTLLVVPCFYSIAEDWRALLARAWRRIAGAPRPVADGSEVAAK